jgi:hypothetical protein
MIVLVNGVAIVMALTIVCWMLDYDDEQDER